jgi:hypothetical protein
MVQVDCTELSNKPYHRITIKGELLVRGVVGFEMGGIQETSKAI